MSDNGFSEEIQKVLQEDLKVHTRRGAGANYKYFKGEDVLKQLNKAFAHCWSSEVISSEEVHGQILVQASVSVFVEGAIVVHHGFGSSSIARTNKDQKVIDIGNSYKAAYTGAIKKAAEQFGIGLGASDLSVPEPTKTPNSTPTHQTFSPPPAKETTPPASREPIKPAGGLKPRIPKASATTPKLTSPGIITGRFNSSAPNIANTPKTEKGLSLGYATHTDELSGLLSDAQKGAIQKLTEKKGITVSEAIEKSLKVSDKILDTLTKAEAVLVIRYSNTVRVGA